MGARRAELRTAENGRLAPLTALLLPLSSALLRPDLPPDHADTKADLSEDAGATTPEGGEVARARPVVAQTSPTRADLVRGSIMCFISGNKVALSAVRARDFTRWKELAHTYFAFTSLVREFRGVRLEESSKGAVVQRRTTRCKSGWGRRVNVAPPPPRQLQFRPPIFRSCWTGTDGSLLSAGPLQERIYIYILIPRYFETLRWKTF